MKKTGDSFKITSGSRADTMRIGDRLGRLLGAGDLVALYGDLGTGKTTFAKGIARGLGVPESALRVTSPTFALINEYEGRRKIYHVDWYRLDRVKGPDRRMAEECFCSEAVTVVEWADRGADQLPPERLEVRLKHGIPSKRIIEVRSVGKKFDRYPALLKKEIKKDAGR